MTLEQDTKNIHTTKFSWVNFIKWQLQVDFQLMHKRNRVFFPKKTAPNSIRNLQLQHPTMLLSLLIHFAMSVCVRFIIGNQTLR